MYKTIIITMLLFAGCKIQYELNNDKILTLDKVYFYESFYINSTNDTLIRDTLILRTLNKSWIFQPKQQELIEFCFSVDSIQMMKYVDPETSYRRMDERYLAKHNKPEIHKTERTGAITLLTSNKIEFFLHPPRQNQYRMLSYVAFPRCYYLYNNEKELKLNGHLKIPLIGKFNQNYLIRRKVESQKNNSQTHGEIFTVVANSKLDNPTKNLDTILFNSNLEAEFSTENGFLFMNYTFANQIKINFKLIKISQD